MGRGNARLVCVSGSGCWSRASSALLSALHSLSPSQQNPAKEPRPWMGNAVSAGRGEQVEPADVFVLLAAPEPALQHEPAGLVLRLHPSA